jgi:hypothetical protein
VVEAFSEGGSGQSSLEGEGCGREGLLGFFSLFLILIIGYV